MESESAQTLGNRVALVCSEPLRPRMAGIGIRYLEMAKALREHDFEILLLSPASAEECLALDLPAHRFQGGQDVLPLDFVQAGQRRILPACDCVAPGFRLRCRRFQWMLRLKQPFRIRV